MKRFMLVAALAAVTTSLNAAPKDDLDAAIKKLGDSENYQWKTTVDAGGGFGSGSTSGKTSKDGLMMVSRTFGENTTEAVLKGEKGAVKTEDGWQSFEELQANPGGGGRGRGGRGFGAFFMRNTRTPAVEAADLLGKIKEVKSADGVYSGDLTTEGAGSFVTFGGRGRRGGGNPPPAPANAKGTAKFWLKDGALTKYEYHVEGTIAGPNGDFDIDRTTTVEISNVGSTKLEVPADAKKKLE